MRKNPKRGEQYRHFLGNVYEIVALAEHTETLEELVVYFDVKDPKKIFARPLTMFMSVVDREKFPDAWQEYRFELISGDSAAGDEDYPTADEKADSADEYDEYEGVPKELLRFLDADTYEKRLDVIASIKRRGALDDALIDAIAVSLDTEIKAGDIEERYSELREYLLMLDRFECNRLR